MPLTEQYFLKNKIRVFKREIFSIENVPKQNKFFLQKYCLREQKLYKKSFKQSKYFYSGIMLNSYFYRNRKKNFTREHKYSLIRNLKKKNIL